jgi:hypothetical protein
MTRHGKNITIVVDGYTRVLLTVIAVLLTVLAAGMWYEAPSMTPAAGAAVRGLPDEGQQLDEIRSGIEQLNATMDRLASVLVSGEVKVQVMESAGSSSAPKSDGSSNSGAAR